MNGNNNNKIHDQKIYYLILRLKKKSSPKNRIYLPKSHTQTTKIIPVKVKMSTRLNFLRKNDESYIHINFEKQILILFPIQFIEIHEVLSSGIEMTLF